MVLALRWALTACYFPCIAARYQQKGKILCHATTADEAIIFWHHGASDFGQGISDYIETVNRMRIIRGPPQSSKLLLR